MLRNSASRQSLGAGTGSSSGGGKGKDDENPQLVAVAVDGDKNSQHALKWAADHVISRGYIFVLLHVRNPTLGVSAGQYLPISGLEGEVGSPISEQMDIQTQELLMPFQCFCSRRGLNCREVILDDMNISKAIVDFLVQHGVDKLVLGASCRNAFSRTFKQADVPSSVSKSAPEFCSVYVISKGRMSSYRPATRPKTYSFSGLAIELQVAANPFQSSKSDTLAKRHVDAAPRRLALINSTRAGYGSKPVTSLGYDQRNNEPQELSCYSIASCPSPSRTSIDKKSSYSPRRLHDGGRQRPHLSASPKNVNSYLEEQTRNFESYRTAIGSSSYEQLPQIDEAELEMRQLKLELKMAVDKYEDASQKVYSSKADVKPTTGDRCLRTSKMNKKEEKRSGIQVTERKESVSGSAIDRVLPKLGNKFSSDVQFKKYSIEEIKEVTNNFSESLKVGEGGYGPVFKCTLDQIPVAIKIPRPDVARGMEQFQQEVEVLSSIRHPNLVLLVGACPEHGCLVYEYMSNGNLEDRIFCQSGTAPLSWQLRFKIAAEIASALLYLHQTKPEPLVHRDLKPANILLNENFVSKITDVGLARLLPTNTSTCSSQYLATAAAGTFCYIDPEYQKTGTVGVKSDVYALGIILLQLITARPPMGLAHHVENAMEMDKLEEMLDPTIPDWPVEEAVKLAKIGMMCAELRRRDRPDLGSVVLPELYRLREFAESSL